MRKLLPLALLLFSLSAEAYIPHFWMIMSRTAENHGRGIYKIEQLVTFYHGSEPLSVHETWYVKDGETLRVRVKGQGNLSKSLNMTYLYQGKNRYYLSQDGIVRKSSVGPGWAEPYFHFRYSKKIKAKMLAQGIIPREGVRDPVKAAKVNEIKHGTESFVRLSRSQGVVTFGIGTPTPVGAKPLPGLWIEQDSFHIRKLRLASGVEVVADDYQKHSRSLWFPRTREIRWDGNRVKVKTLTVKRLGNSKKAKKMLSTSSLNAKEDPSLIGHFPEDPVIKEFYSKIR